MNLPKYVIEILATEFTPEQVVKLNAEWDGYAQISFSNSSKEQIIATGRMVLRYFPSYRVKAKVKAKVKAAPKLSRAAAFQATCDKMAIRNKAAIDAKLAELAAK